MRTKFVIGRGLAVLCGLVILFGDVSSARAASLSQLAEEYQKAKREFKLASTPGRRPGGRRRGGGKKAPPAKIEPILLRIAKLNTAAALKFLVKEYADPHPGVIAASADALLSMENKAAVRSVAVRAVIGGFDRGRKWPLSAKVHVLDLLAADPSDDAFEFVLRQAKGTNAELKIIALGSLSSRPKNRDALAVALDALSHRSFDVRRAAFRTLKKFRDKSMVPALIERIGKEKDAGLKTENLQLLVKLAGVNMGLVTKDWEKWWQVEGDNFKLGKPDDGRTRVVATDMTYFGIEVSSKRIAFLVDASKSMQGGAGGGKKGGGRKGKGGKGGGRRKKIDVLKEELTGILKKLPPTTAVNIIYFHRTAFSWKDRLQLLKGKGREEAISFVQSLTLELKTAIYDALEMALKDKRVDTIYLLSDGLPIGGKISEPNAILREVRAMNRIRGAKIHCISFGKETEFLKKLAAQNDGVYRTTNPNAGKKAGGKKAGGKKAGGKKAGGKKAGGKNGRAGRNGGGKNGRGKNGRGKNGGDPADP